MPSVLPASSENDTPLTASTGGASLRVKRTPRLSTSSSDVMPASAGPPQGGWPPPRGAANKMSVGVVSFSAILRVERVTQAVANEVHAVKRHAQHDGRCQQE